MLKKTDEWLIEQLNNALAIDTFESQEERIRTEELITKIVCELDLVYNEESIVTLVPSSDFYHQCLSKNKKPTFSTDIIINKRNVRHYLIRFAKINGGKISIGNIEELREKSHNEYFYNISWQNGHNDNYRGYDITFCSYKKMTNEQAAMFLYD